MINSRLAYQSRLAHAQQGIHGLDVLPLEAVHEKRLEAPLRRALV
jgi:hypothetical protein